MSATGIHTLDRLPNSLGQSIEFKGQQGIDSPLARKRVRAIGRWGRINWVLVLIAVMANLRWQVFPDCAPAQDIAELLPVVDSEPIFYG